MQRVLIVLLLVTASKSAQAWSVGLIKGDNDKAEIGRITCGLLEKYGPSRSYHDLSVAIPDSPYGPLTATMGPSRWMEIGVSTQRFPAQPAEAVRDEIRAWFVSHLPKQPRACTFLLASPARLDRVGYPDVPPMVPEEDYVSIQLDLAAKAATVDPDMVWRWADGALAALRGLEQPARRRFVVDPRMRAAAYAVVSQPAPPGLSDLGKKGYCVMYETVRKIFPPRSPSEARSLKKARRAVGCK